MIIRLWPASDSELHVIVSCWKFSPFCPVGILINMFGPNPLLRYQQPTKATTNGYLIDNMYALSIGGYGVVMFPMPLLDHRTTYVGVNCGLTAFVVINM